MLACVLTLKFALFRTCKLKPEFVVNVVVNAGGGNPWCFNKEIFTPLFQISGISPSLAKMWLMFLQELVLRDNQLKKLPDVSILKSLLVFDISFNEISSLSGLSKFTTTLKELYVSKNEIPKMEEIEHFHDLQLLELGSNRLRVGSWSLEHNSYTTVKLPLTPNGRKCMIILVICACVSS